MPRTPIIKPFKDSGRKKPWRVDIPATISPTGKRARFFFDTKGDADGYAEEQKIRLKNFGITGAGILPPADQEQAANALKLLEPYGVSLNEVVNEWISRRRAAEASVTFEDAMDAFKGYGRRSESYVRSIRQTRNRLTSLHGKLLNQITPADLTLAMDGMKPSVKNFSIRILGGLFNYGMKRDYCASNPVQKVDGGNHRRGETQIYTPAQAAAILHATEKHDPALVPFMAISFFAGIRLSEMHRLDWSAIDLEEKFIRLPANITKTNQRRVIDISTTLAAWINPRAHESGRVIPCSPDVLRNRLAELKKHHKVPTIKHGPRHCFASYWLAEHGDINQLCRYLGHDDAETTLRHYAKAATKREAIKFHAILPKAKLGAKVIPMKEAA